MPSPSTRNIFSGENPFLQAPLPKRGSGLDVALNSFDPVHFMSTATPLSHADITNVFHYASPYEFTYDAPRNPRNPVTAGSSQPELQAEIHGYLSLINS